jgi:SpoVK/Ycf46/Vps4 family AAA+-type ATPase
MRRSCQGLQSVKESTISDLEGKHSASLFYAHRVENFSSHSTSVFHAINHFSLGIGSSVDLSAVAAVTRGLCGADLEFIVNEAAIRAVRRVSSKLRAGTDPASITPTVTSEDFEKSVLDFYEMRKPKGGVGDILSNVLGM